MSKPDILLVTYINDLLALHTSFIPRSPRHGSRNSNFRTWQRLSSPHGLLTRRGGTQTDSQNEKTHPAITRLFKLPPSLVISAVSLAAFLSLQQSPPFIPYTGHLPIQLTEACKISFHFSKSHSYPIDRNLVFTRTRVHFCSSSSD